MTTETTSISVERLKFFELIFGVSTGEEPAYLCIASTNPDAPKISFTQRFFEWPKEYKEVEGYILRESLAKNVYFCVNLLSRQERKKNFCLPSSLLWADLDDVNPDTLTKLPPSIVIQSSPGRWQALWKLTTAVPPFQAEEYSRRLGYSVGADKSGWDLTQLLRVPYTKNFKYHPPAYVGIERAADVSAKPLLFEALPVGIDFKVEGTPEGLEELTAEGVIYKYSSLIKKSPFYALYTQEPGEDDDWSSVLWRLLHESFKMGMSPEEVFVVSREAKCNKYARDGRPIEHLWRDVIKAGESYNLDISPDLITMPVLVEEGDPRLTHTFIDDYREWAMEATDAVPDFHDLCIFIALSAIISNSVKLETSAGMLIPNLWGLVLGDSTLTRKTTSMRMVMDFLITMDNELVLATDGTAEGMLSGLAARPNKATVFYKDEISGFFDSMNKKDYMAGLQETLTALYDVPSIYIRRLRKETIVVESPSFVFLGGGVPDRIYSSINDGFVLSGFLPRFLVVHGEAGLDDRRALGPPTNAGLAKRPVIFNKLADLFETYAKDVEQNIGGQPNIRVPRYVMVKPTPAAWAANAKYEAMLLEAAGQSLLRNLALPTFDRLSRSLFKMAMILAAVRQIPKKDETIVMDECDVVNAAYYVQQWGKNSVQLVVNAGKDVHEKYLERIYNFINDKPGIMRSQIMQRFHMNSRDMSAIMQTLEDRGQVRTERRGKGYAYWIA